MRELESLQAAIAEREAELSAAESRLRKARALLESDKQALSRVLDLITGPDKKHVEAPITRDTVKTTIISAILAMAPGDRAFSSSDVTEYLERQPPDRVPFDIEKNRANISTYMGKDLVVGGLLQIVAKGSGRRPTLFKLNG